MKYELNSIGLNKKPADTTVVVAMSGGVELLHSSGNDEKRRL